MKRSCEPCPKDPIWRQPINPASVVFDLSAVWAESPGDQTKQCGLTRAVRADETCDRALIYGEAYPIDSAKSAEAALEIADLENAIAHLMI